MPEDDNKVSWGNVINVAVVTGAVTAAVGFVVPAAMIPALGIATATGVFWGLKEAYSAFRDISHTGIMEIQHRPPSKTNSVVGRYSVEKATITTETVNELPTHAREVRPKLGKYDQPKKRSAFRR